MATKKVLATILILSLVTFFSAPMTAFADGGPSKCPVPTHGISLDKTVKLVGTALSPVDLLHVNVPNPQVEYHFLVTNTGTVTLNDVSVSDSTIDWSSAPVTLEPGHTKDFVFSPFSIVSWNTDNEFTNTAVATGKYCIHEEDDFDFSFSSLSFGLNCIKPQDPPKCEIITAQDTATVINDYVELMEDGTLIINKDITNNETPSDVEFEFTITGSDLKADLIVSASEMVPASVELFPGTYTVTETTRGDYISNTSPITVTIAENQTTEIDFLNTMKQPNFSITKAVDKSNVNTKDTTLEYTITITNTGNVDLESILLSDPILGWDNIDIGSIDLEDGPYSTTASITLNASDWESNTFTNTATATIRLNDAELSRSASADTYFDDPGTTEALIHLDKSVETPTVSSQDVTVVYTFTVSNVGDFDLYNVHVYDSTLGFTINFEDILAVGGESFTTTRAFDLSLLGTPDNPTWTGETFENFADVHANSRQDQSVTDNDSAIVTYDPPGVRRTSRTTTTVVESLVPAAPIPEVVPEVVVAAAPVPAAPLPKTGGLDPLFLYGLGALLAGGGLTLKRRKR